MHEIGAELQGVSTRKQKKEIGRQRRMPSHLKGGVLFVGRVRGRFTTKSIINVGGLCPHCGH